MSLTVGPADVSVSSLGRWVVAGSTGDHVVKLVDATTSADVPGGAATGGDRRGARRRLAYGALAAPVTLRANGRYLLVSRENAGGDAWFNLPTNLVTTDVARVTGWAYAAGANPAGFPSGALADQGFGPLSFRYGGQV